MMARSATKGPAPKHDATPAKPETTLDVELQFRGKGGKSFSARVRGNDSNVHFERQRLLGEVTQRMAELRDLDTSNAEALKEADQLSGKISQMLYQGQIGGIIDKQTVSDTLVQQFGAVPKKDGTPGKTPMGQGATIRKRLVRGVAAHDFAENGDGGAFFDGIEPDWTVAEDDDRTVADIVAAVNDGELTVWTAYDLFQKIKSYNSERAELAFDVKRINAIAAKLAAAPEASAEAFVNNPDLAVAYAKLRDIFEIVDARAAELAE
jgi:hypothetical protein